MYRGIKGGAFLAGVGLAGLWPATAFADQPIDHQTDGNSSSEIVVYAHSPDRGIFVGVAPENELTQADIAAYGADTVGDLLDQIQGQVDGSVDGPVILINGRQVAGVDDVTDLPTEAVSRIQVLPNRVAGQLGQTPTRRVINVVVKDNHRQITGNFEFGFATAGGGHSYVGELNLLRIKAGNRDSLVMKVQQYDPLLESDRDITSEPTGAAYDRVGNVVSYPFGGAEIDPALSLVAGRPVSVAGVPAAIIAPSLAAIAANADRANATDVRPFRTLSPERRVYSVNGNMTRRFGETIVSLNARGEWTRTSSLSGLAGAVLGLPVSSPFSPFSRAVGVARYVGDPLRQDGTSSTLNFNGNLSTPLGRWRMQAIAILSHRVSRGSSDVAFDPAPLQAAIDAGTVSPFGNLPAALTLPGRNSTYSRSDNALLRVTFAGPLLRMPAGPVRAAVSASLRTDRLRGSSQFLGVAQIAGYARNEAALQVNLQVPLLGDKSGVGVVALNLNGLLRQIRQIGTVADYGTELVWRPVPRLSLQASFNVERLAPSAQSLSDPILVNDNYRLFDFLTGQTVLVRYLSGGNPDLRPARQRTLQFGGTFTPFARINLNLSAELTSRRSTDVQASLPPVGAAVQAAFPDRFQRDANGVLVLVDSRPVTFAYEDSDQLHWRIDYHGSLGGRRPSSVGASGGDADPVFSSDGSLRTNLTLEHTWTLNWVRRARAGLPEVDLLAGGAVGYGGGLPRHEVRLSANVAARGVGVQIDGSWRSATVIRSDVLPSANDLFFSARTLVNARVFADLGTLFPRERMLKGARLSISAINLLDSRQRVRDATGDTPLRYQPYVQEPFGRTVAFGFRKAF